MRAVLYTQDLDPLLVVELSGHAQMKLERGEAIRVSETPKLSMRLPSPGPFESPTLKIYDIRAEPVRRRGHMTFMLFTDPEAENIVRRALSRLPNGTSSDAEFVFELTSALEQL